MIKDLENIVRKKAAAMGNARKLGQLSGLSNVSIINFINGRTMLPKNIDKIIIGLNAYASEIRALADIIEMEIK